MRMQRTIAVLLLCCLLGASAACGRRAPRPAAPTLDPSVNLDRAMQDFHRGNFRRAQLTLQRLTFEYGPGQPQLAQVRYYLAECSFQLGEHVQAAADFRRVADDFSTSEYAPLALLRAGDSN